MTAAVQTLWAELIAASLADAGVRVCVISPGSRSTPLVTAFAALARDHRLELVTIIDERAAAFYALGVARATDHPVALACTSGSAAAHYLPALVEASLAGIPLVALTADRPPELHHCGASQTIPQVGMYGAFVRGAFDLGAPVASAQALRAVRRTVVQAITLARGPHPGPVHLEIPLRKPLEPATPATPDERELARVCGELRASACLVAPPRLTAESAALAELAAAIAHEPDGVIVAGALPARFAQFRDGVLALAVRAGYPIIAEAASQLRFGPRDRSIVGIDHFDLIPTAELPRPKLVVQLGAEPVATGWPAWLAAVAPARWVLTGHAWHDPDATARAVILGDVGDAITRVGELLEHAHSERAIAERFATATRWLELEAAATTAVEAALAAHPRSETATMRAAVAALPDGGLVQIGNSLPIRVVDHACTGGGSTRVVLSQRGAAGIDGLVASAAGATRAGRPVLLVLGDVSFAHDVGALLVARDAAMAPLVILVLDNRGGQIFAGLPISRADLGAAFADHWLTAPGLDPAAVASAFGVTSVTAASPSAVGAAVAAALGSTGGGVTVIHAPVAVSGAHDVRRTAIEMFVAPAHERRLWRSS